MWFITGIIIKFIKVAYNIIVLIIAISTSRVRVMTINLKKGSYVLVSGMVMHKI